MQQGNYTCGEGQKSLHPLDLTHSTKDSETPLSSAVRDSLSRLLAVQHAPPGSSGQGIVASYSCYHTTSSNIGECGVPKGSTAAEDLCGPVLLHHLFYYVRFKNALHRMQY